MDSGNGASPLSPSTPSPDTASTLPAPILKHLAGWSWPLRLTGQATTQHPQPVTASGWRIHRIWSTEWLRNRETELDKAEEAWKQVVEMSENDEAPVEVEQSRDAESDPAESTGSGWSASTCRGEE